MPRIGKKGCNPMSARGYTSTGIQHRIYIKKEDVPRWNVIREKSGYTKSPDFVHWLIEVAEQHLRIKSSDYQTEGNAGDDSQTSDDSEEEDGDGDDDDDEDTDDDEEDDDDDDGDYDETKDPQQYRGEKHQPKEKDINPADIKIEAGDVVPSRCAKEVSGLSRRQSAGQVAIKDVSPVICIDLDAPRQLRPRLKLKLKPFKVEPPVEKKRGRKKSLIRQPRKEHPASYPCKKCCRIFPDRRALRKHQVVHDPESLTCRDCQMTFNSKSALWVHRKVHHGRKTVACEHCDLTFTRKYQLKEHMRSHKGLKPFACPTCNKKFRTTAHMTSHMDLHSDFRRYLCDLCGLTFHRRDLLSRHIIKHSQPKTFSCEECGKVFAYKVTLQDHIIRHQNVKAGKTPYKCQTCLKEFFTPKSYQHHMGRHRGERVFPCDLCDKKFKQKFYLDRHKIIHREEKPYTCSNCGRGFTQHSNMAIHMRTHTGEKPYQCDLCDKAFAHNVSLKTHKKTAHGIDMWLKDKTKPVVALGRPRGEPKKKPPPKIRLKSQVAAVEMQMQSELYQAAVEFARERLAPLAFPTIPQIPALHSSRAAEQMSLAHSPSESDEDTPSPRSSSISLGSPGDQAGLDPNPIGPNPDNQPPNHQSSIHDHNNHQPTDLQPAQDVRLPNQSQPTHNHQLSPDSKPPHDQLSPCNQHLHCIGSSQNSHQDFGHHEAASEIQKQIVLLPHQFRKTLKGVADHLPGTHSFLNRDPSARDIGDHVNPLPHVFPEPSHDLREPVTPIPQGYGESSHNVRDQLTPISQAYQEHSTIEQQQQQHVIATAASRCQTPNSPVTSIIEQPHAHIIHNTAVHSAEHQLRLDKPGPYGPLLHSPNAHSDYPTRHEKVEEWHQRNSEALSWMSRGMSHAQLMQGLRAVTPNMMHPVSQALGMLNPQAQEHVNLVGGYTHSAYIPRGNTSSSQPMQPPSWRS